MKIKQTKDIRSSNRMAILRNIINNETISRAEVSEQTKLNKATVSTIVKEWIDLHILTETSLGDSTGGRKPIMLKQVALAGYCIAIEISVTTIDIILTDLTNHILYEHSLPLLGDQFTTNFKQLYIFLDKMIIQLPSSVYGLVGIGVSIRGVVDLQGVIRNIPKLKWKNIDIKTLLEDKFHVPVYVDNDGNLAALSELKHHGTYQDIAVINVSDVLSTGLVANNKLIRGFLGFANALAHHTINFKETYPCACGKFGCWEQYCSNSVVLAEMNEYLDKPITAIEDYIRLLKNNDSNALIVLNHFIDALAIGLANVIFILNCEVVIINSQIIDAFPELISNILDRIVLPITQTQEIKRSLLGKQASILGASDKCIELFYSELANS